MSEAKPRTWWISEPRQPRRYCRIIAHRNETQVPPDLTAPWLRYPFVKVIEYSAYEAVVNKYAELYDKYAEVVGEMNFWRANKP